MIEYIVIFFLFYIFAILQNSFFVHFNFFGAVPNLVFILFYLLAFFSTKKRNYSATWEVTFYAIAAGLFLDVFSSAYFGISIILLLIIGILSKKVQSMLQESSNDKFPITYFLPLFLISWMVYDFTKGLALNQFVFPSIAGIIYNLGTATIGFYIYRKFFSYEKLQS